ncbi:hypothetical protein PH562_28775 [Rhizobium sp. CNPSo 4062]|uniref:hypothetical protein n=1 Tax=Rhizobium sp. CNPSo 4062 TaxID=3021410 RepID=UPI00254C9871|nr:hypothetical protein [Rhizobium sp. CNPSo 4062]MDK4706272.1 hypothetical protein [Rhizobium sp. CNPSo 4062]
MPGAMTDGALSDFEAALAKLSDGYSEGRFRGRPWGVTVKRSADGKRVWLYGEELGGTDIVSFNLYVLSGASLTLKPCEMSASKVVDFVLGFMPAQTQPV